MQKLDLEWSKITYKQKNEEKKMTGEIQGKANVPQRLNLQKDQMIQAHNKLSTGVELYAPDTKRKIMHHGVIFVDNRTVHTTGSSEQENTTKDCQTVQIARKRVHAYGTT